jgi:hypothetical protein
MLLAHELWSQVLRHWGKARRRNLTPARSRRVKAGVERRGCRGKRHVFPCRFCRQREGRQSRPSSVRRVGGLCSVLGRLGSGLWRLPCFLLRSELLPYLGGDGVGIHFIYGGSFFENGRRIAPRGRQQDAGLDRQPGEVPSSARRINAVRVLATPPSSRFWRMPCCRASISTRFSSMTLTSFSRMKSRSRFMRRTGTAALTAARTRRPVVLAMACSLRCLSCSAFHFSSLRLVGCFG